MHNFARHNFVWTVAITETINYCHFVLSPDPEKDQNHALGPAMVPVETDMNLLLYCKAEMVSQFLLMTPKQFYALLWMKSCFIKRFRVAAFGCNNHVLDCVT